MKRKNCVMHHGIGKPRALKAMRYEMYKTELNEDLDVFMGLIPDKQIGNKKHNEIISQIMTNLWSKQYILYGFWFWGGIF